MIIDCISDLHGHYPKLEGGDLLIVAGDLTGNDEFMEWQAFSTWLCRQKYRKKVFIAGNHDNYLFINQLMIMPLVGPQDLTSVEFLMDSGIEFEGLKIWGSPWTKSFPGMNPHCKAFTVDTEEELAEKWKLIPNDVDILITHSPAFGILDEIDSVIEGHVCDKNTGSKSLLTKVQSVWPKLFVCGHIHEAYAERKYHNARTKSIHCVNASHVNEHYQPVNKPIRVIL